MENSLEISSVLGRMEQIVLEVGRHLLEIRDTDAIQGEWQGTQLKTEADMMAHRQLSSLLKALDNTIPVVSEEDQDSQGDSRPHRYWLIDPIDGTASFAGGYSGFVTQIALMEDGEPLMAAIYAPELGQSYLAERGKGAVLNGKSLTVAQESKKKVLVDNYPEPRGTAFDAMLALGFSDYLECGSISLKICRVADGSADVFFKDVVVRDWDLAAPHLVLKEAGGILKLIDGFPVLYQGNYEKRQGIVASREEALCTEIVEWMTLRFAAAQHSKE